MRSQLKGTDRQETPVDFTGIEKMKDRADKKAFSPQQVKMLEMDIAIFVEELMAECTLQVI